MVKKNFQSLVLIFLVLICFIVFGRITLNDFVNYDDNLYLTENPCVQAGFTWKTIAWAFSSTVGGNWHPLTLFSHILDWQLFGHFAGGHHGVSLLLHIGSVIFLFLFLLKTTHSLEPSAFAAAFFALHPLRVESVAWAAERKDVLCLFFGMASLYAYAFYVENRTFSKYALCLLLFTLGLMSKPMLVTLPFVLLLLDFWPLNRLESLPSKTQNPKPSLYRLLLEKIPFLLLSTLASLLTLWAQAHEGAVTSLGNIGLTTRLFHAFYSYIVYLGKIFWPIDLAVFYTYNFFVSPWKIVVSVALVLSITTMILFSAKKLPFLLVGWFWYLGTLVPVIGIIQVGKQDLADRYTYLPSIGIAILVAWGISHFVTHEKTRRIVCSSAIIVLLTLSGMTFKQCGYWKSSYTLFQHTLKVNKSEGTQPANYGADFTAMGGYQYQSVIDEFNKKLRLHPDHPTLYYHRGLAYAKIGQYQKAIQDFNMAIQLKPDYIEALNTRGLIYAQYNQNELALADFNQIIAIHPHYEKAYHNRGLIYSKLGKIQKSLEDFNMAIHLKADYSEAYKNRAGIYFQQGNFLSGCADAQKACNLGNCGILEDAYRKGLCR